MSNYQRLRGSIWISALHGNAIWLVLDTGRRHESRHGRDAENLRRGLTRSSDLSTFLATTA